METAARFDVTGRVQGVGFRWFAARAARDLGLAGWVRNSADGTVQAVAAGGASALDAFEGELRRGPAGARVESVLRESLESVERLPDPFSIIK